MIVNNFNLFSVACMPFKANAPLFVNAYAPSAFLPAPQGFQSIRRRQTQIIDPDCSVKGVEFRESPLLKIVWKFLRKSAMKYFLGFATTK
jgi:hypothetical protein